MRIYLLICCLIVAAFAACTTDNSRSGNSSPQTPKTDAPQPKMPQVKMPGTGSYGTGSYGTGNYGVPEINVPRVNIPEVKIPEIKTPGVRVQGNDELVLITLPADVLFDFDKADIRLDADAALRQVLQVLNERYAGKGMLIGGHTDSKASDDYNQDLSERRAESVKSWFENRGVEEARMATKGYGETQPVAPNNKPDGADDPGGRQLNRRVEIVIKK